MLLRLRVDESGDIKMGSNLLDRILERKRQEVEEARAEVPESHLREQADLPRARRHFIDRLAEPGPYGINIIAEIKRASPSRGPIRMDLDPASYARAYEKGGAAALSVLTDGPHFQGSPEDLRRARRATRLPVLRKDFLIDTYQIYESVVMEADCVLLIVRAVPRGLLKECLNLCSELGLDALVEVHSEEELGTATRAGARLIGINNRDLNTFKTDIETSVGLCRHLEADQIAVAESGIRGRADLEKLYDAGFWNFLIGESLVKASNPGRFMGDLMGRAGNGQQSTIGG